MARAWLPIARTVMRREKAKRILRGWPPKRPVNEVCQAASGPTWPYLPFPPNLGGFVLGIGNGCTDCGEENVGVDANCSGDLPCLQARNMHAERCMND